MQNVKGKAGVKEEALKIKNIGEKFFHIANKFLSKMLTLKYVPHFKKY